MIQGFLASHLCSGEGGENHLKRRSFSPPSPDKLSTCLRFVLPYPPHSLAGGAHHKTPICRLFVYGIIQTAEKILCNGGNYCEKEYNYRNNPWYCNGYCMVIGICKRIYKYSGNRDWYMLRNILWNCICYDVFKKGIINPQFAVKIPPLFERTAVGVAL